MHDCEFESLLSFESLKVYKVIKFLKLESLKSSVFTPSPQGEG